MSKYWDNVETQRLRDRVFILWVQIAVVIFVVGAAVAFVTSGSGGSNLPYLIGACVALGAWIAFGDRILAWILSRIDALRGKRGISID